MMSSDLHFLHLCLSYRDKARGANLTRTGRQDEGQMALGRRKVKEWEEVSK